MREGIAFLEMGGTMGFKDMHLARLAVSAGLVAALGVASRLRPLRPWLMRSRWVKMSR